MYNFISWHPQLIKTPSNVIINKASSYRHSSFARTALSYQFVFVSLCLCVFLHAAHVSRTALWSRTLVCACMHLFRKKKKRAEWEARRMNDADGHAFRIGCVLEDSEDGKKTVDAHKLGINARERNTQQPPCWSSTSCSLL